MIIEDDRDDQQLMVEVFTSLNIKNELKFFENGNKALAYLKTTTDQPFIILSDVNLPGMSGPDFKRSINEDDRLRQKSIPFVFLTTSAEKKAVEEAYDILVQGYFQKANKMDELKAMVKMIMDYWMECKNPNS
jgi:CheY-like chemotaxis protein